MKLFAFALLIAAVAADDAARSARSVVGLGHGIGVPIGVAGPAVLTPGILSPAVVGHGVLAPGLIGHGSLIRHGRSVVGVPTVLGAPGVVLAGQPGIATVGVAGLVGPALVPAIGHGVHGPIGIHG